MKNLDQINFSELEGKEVIYRLCNGDKIILVVGGCDFDIGLSLYRKGEPDNHYICLNGESSPYFHRASYLICYKPMFEYCIQGIINGYLSSERLKRIKEKAFGGPIENSYGSLQCAFSA